LPPLVKIPLTEECKLLPLTGIYAVTVSSDYYSSKGMAIINKRSDNVPEVLLNIFENENFNSDNKITVSFHKMIHGAVNFSDIRSISKVNLAIEEISELIY
jgi:FAD synthase